MSLVTLINPTAHPLTYYIIIIIMIIVINVPLPQQYDAYHLEILSIQQ